MLLLSPGDDSAFLPLDSLHKQPDVISDCPSGTECHQAAADAPANTDLKASGSKVGGSKVIEGNRHEAVVSTHTAFAAARVGDRSALPPAALAPSSDQQSALARDSYLTETALDGLYALRQAGRSTTVRRPQTSVNRLACTTLLNTAGEWSGSYAAPLASLRERDMTALAALFQRDDIGAIEADVSHRLRSLLPEPCWEEDVFAFLQEFLADR